MSRTRTLVILLAIVLAIGVGAVVAQADVTETTVERASEAFGGGDADGASYLPWITPDGRYAIFDSWATNLIPGGTSFMQHIYLRDFQSQETTLVSQSTTGVAGNNTSSAWDLSDDGRYVVFDSTATNLDPADANPFGDVFVRDLVAGTTTLVSVSDTETAANRECSTGMITNDGRYVFFVSDADNLVVGDTAFSRDIFVRDLVAGTTTRLTDTPPSLLVPPFTIHFSQNPSISDDGRYMAFAASYDAMGDGFGAGLFVLDRSLNTTERVDVTIDATGTTAPSYFPFISGDGRYVTFHSNAENLVEGDTNGPGNDGKDVFVRDLLLDTTERVSVSSAGVQGNGESRWSSITDDGRYVAFHSKSDNLVAGDTNGSADVFIHDRWSGRTELASKTAAGVQGNGVSEAPWISGDGSRVVFRSYATNLVPGDNAGILDVFMADVAWDEEGVAFQGTDRFSTSVAISKGAYAGSATSTVDTVIVTTGFNWPDALGGAALAGAVDGPILLSQKDSIPGAVLAEIRRLEPTRAFILGGEGVVGPAVFAALEAEVGAGNVTRLGGSNRYETSRVIAERTVAELGIGYDGTVYVATGGNFPDALAASPMSAHMGWPILVVGSTLDAATVTSMGNMGVSDAIILGGTGVVPGAVETALEGELGAVHVSRLAGSDRYHTAALVAQESVDSSSLHWDSVALATGENFPDALTGGVLQAKSGSVMLLTPSATLHSRPQSKLSANADVIWEVRYLGGTGAISQTVRNAALAAIE